MKQTSTNQTKKSLLKKTILNPGKDEDKNTETKLYILEEKTKFNKNQKETKAEFLIKLILKAFYLSLWKRQAKALKYYLGHIILEE